MTIFFEVAYDLINEKVGTTKTKTTGLDGSLKNQVVTYAGTTTLGHQLFEFFGVSAGRDQELGVLKRGRIDQLLPTIQQISKDTDDQKTLENLIKLITRCRNDTEQATLTHGQSNGITEKAMDNLIILLRDIFAKLESLKLLNIPRDKDPLNSFRYHVALYHRRKIAIGKEDPGLFEPFYHAQKIAFAIQQESLIAKALQKCTSALTILEERMSLEDPRYLAIRLDHISLSIMRLGRQNEQLITQFTGILGGSPNDGLLEKCVRDAEAEIIGQPVAGAGAGAGAGAVPPKSQTANTETLPPKSLTASTETLPPKSQTTSTETLPPKSQTTSTETLQTKSLTTSAEPLASKSLAANPETAPADNAKSEQLTLVAADDDLNFTEETKGLPSPVAIEEPILPVNTEVVTSNMEQVATTKPRSPLPPAAQPSAKPKKGKKPQLQKTDTYEGAPSTFNPN